MYLYGFLKILRSHIPLGPTVSSISSLSYSLAAFLHKVLRPLAEKAEFIVINSGHFLELL
jgi:hypothetical protein